MSEDPTPVKTKPIWKSKTALVNFVIGLIATFAPESVQQYVEAHPQSVLYGFIVLNLALRWITHEKVSLFGSDD